MIAKIVITESALSFLDGLYPITVTAKLKAGNDGNTYALVQNAEFQKHDKTKDLAVIKKTEPQINWAFFPNEYNIVEVV